MKIEEVQINFANASSVAYVKKTNGQLTAVAFDTPKDIEADVQKWLLESLLNGTANPYAEPAKNNKPALHITKSKNDRTEDHRLIRHIEDFEALLESPLLRLSLETGLPINKPESQQEKQRTALVDYLLRNHNQKTREIELVKAVADRVGCTESAVRTQINTCRHLGILARDADNNHFLAREFIEGAE